MKYKTVSFVLIQFFIINISITANTFFQRKIQTDTLISNSLAEINADSIKSTIRSLQDFGTRFMLAPNRRDIAVWLKNKFISIGYPNTVIDSFLVEKTWEGVTYNLFQYNVIATLKGELNPEIVYIMGGHYDSFSHIGDPFITAPGADDNASGTAAAIEVARVLKKINYMPAFTIQFVAFGAEELMLAPGGCGSCYFVSQAVASGQKIRMMINNDMISHSTASENWILDLQRYDNSGWVSNLASFIALNYTSLSVHHGELNAWSDSRPFYDAGFFVIYFQENEFSPYYHLSSDTVSNYNMPYCAEIAKVSCGMLLQMSLHPEVQNLHSVQSGSNIRISWNKSKESNVAGYSVYRSLNPSVGYTKINSTILNINDTVFIDTSPAPLTEYYYAAVTLDEMYNAGEILQYDSAMVLTLDQGILIVDDSQNEFLDPPDSVVDIFYDSLLYSYHPHQFDMNSSGAIPLSELGKYSTVLWHTDRFSNSSQFFNSQKKISQYLGSGGNLLLTVERFVYTTLHIPSNSIAFDHGNYVYEYLLCDSIYRNGSSRFYKAKSISSEYPSLEVDTLKTPAASNHHLNFIESIYMRKEADNIYSYDSQYDSATLQGYMIGMPVGYEYLGNDYKLIVLSFPLWYMRYNDVKAFVNYAMQNVFEESVSIPETNSNKSNTTLFLCYPNPFTASTTIGYYLSETDNVKLGIYDINGRLVIELVNKSQLSGTYTYTMNGENLINGIYFCTLKTARSSETVKLVLLK